VPDIPAQIRPQSIPAARPAAAPAFTVRVDLVAGSVELVGTLDRRTVHLFADAVRTLRAADRPEWVIDVAALEHCDVDGLRALSTAYRRALARDRRVVVRSAPPWLCRELARLRLDTHVLDTHVLDGPSRS
jgi:anti-anti-sigma regulatory factor